MKYALSIRRTFEIFTRLLFHFYSSTFLNFIYFCTRVLLPLIVIHSFKRRIRIAGERKLSWCYRRESNEDRSWNKNWQDERRESRKEDSNPICHNQDLGFPKQLSYEIPARSKSSVKFSPNANTRYGNSPRPNYKSDAEFGKQHRPTVYLSP